MDKRNNRTLAFPCAAGRQAGGKSALGRQETYREIVRATLSVQFVPVTLCERPKKDESFTLHRNPADNLKHIQGEAAGF